MKKLVLILTAFAGLLCAADYSTWYPGDHIRFNAGARAAGMGGAVVACIDDASAMYWNPAGVSKVTANEARISGFSGGDGRSGLFLYGAYPTVKYGVFAAGINLHNTTSITGGSASFDDTGNAFTFCYANSIAREYHFGGSLKVLGDNLGGGVKTSMLADFGVIIPLFENINFGAAFENAFSSPVEVLGAETFYPKMLRGGISGNFFNDNLILSFQANKLEGKDPTFLGGFEVRPVPGAVFLRAGIQNGETDYGIGFRYRWYSLDYAAGFRGQEISHWLTAGITFGEFTLGLTATPRVFSHYGDVKVTKIDILAEGRYGIRRWQFSIKNEKGQFIKLVKGRNAPPDSFTWDGKDNDGFYVKDGKYAVELKLFDKVGEEESVSETVEIDTGIPQGDLQMELH